MASGVTGSVSVALHPLVILNISDHWIRMRSQEGRPVQVIGALIGKQEGRNIEVMNSFELLSHTVEEKIIIDKEYYYTKEEQCERARSRGAAWAADTPTPGLGGKGGKASKGGKRLRER